MKKIKIITDSFADLPQSVCVKYGIDVVPASVCVDGLEMPVNTDGCFYSMRQFYMFLEGRTKITFRFADKKDFIEVFFGWLKDGYVKLIIKRPENVIVRIKHTLADAKEIVTVTANRAVNVTAQAAELIRATMKKPAKFLPRRFQNLSPHTLPRIIQV